MVSNIRYVVMLGSAAALAACATTTAPPLPEDNGYRLANTTWRIQDVDGESFMDTNSTMRFGADSFVATLPCSKVTGNFVQDYQPLPQNFVRVTNLKTIKGNCTPTKFQEPNFAGKITGGVSVSRSTDGVVLSLPPMHVALVRIR